MKDFLHVPFNPKLSRTVPSGATARAKEDTSDPQAIARAVSAARVAALRGSST